MYTSHMHMFQIFKMVNEAMKISRWSGTIYKWVPPQENVKNAKNPKPCPWPYFV